MEDLGVDGRYKNIFFQEAGWEGVGMIDLAQDRDWLRALVNEVMNLRGSIKCGQFFD